MADKKTKTKEKAPQAPVQDKFNYNWNREDEFTINGETFQNLINLARVTLESPEAQKVLQAQALSAAIEKVMSAAIQEGKIKVIKNGVPQEVPAPASTEA